MRLCLRLKDAVLEQRTANHLIAKFDLTSIRNKVLSQDTRLYVETLDLSDLRNTAGNDVGGYIEVRSPDIGNDLDWDSHQTTLQTNSTLLIHAPLISNSHYTNPDPMYVYNYKVSQNFLHTTLVIELLFYSLQSNLNSGKFNLLSSLNHPGIIERLKNTAITLVLYDEIDPITEASKDAIKGQNIMRSILPQFKRI